MKRGAKREPGEDGEVGTDVVGAEGKWKCLDI